MFFCYFTKWIFSKSVLKVEQFYLGHFCTKICCQNVSKAAQSGHTECARVSPRFFPAPIPSVESTTLSLILKRQTQTAAKGPSFLSIFSIPSYLSIQFLPIYLFNSFLSINSIPSYLSIQFLPIYLPCLFVVSNNFLACSRFNLNVSTFDYFTESAKKIMFDDLVSAIGKRQMW